MWIPESVSAEKEEVLTNLLGASLIREIDLKINNILTKVKTQRESFPEYQYVMIY